MNFKDFKRSLPILTPNYSSSQFFVSGQPIYKIEKSNSGTRENFVYAPKEIQEPEDKKPSSKSNCFIVEPSYCSEEKMPQNVSAYGYSCKCECKNKKPPEFYDMFLASDVKKSEHYKRLLEKRNDEKNSIEKKKENSADDKNQTEIGNRAPLSEESMEAQSSTNASPPPQQEQLLDGFNGNGQRFTLVASKSEDKCNLAKSIVTLKRINYE